MLIFLIASNFVTVLLQCPRCQSWCSKGSCGVRNVCKPCSKQLHQVYQFCWACRREWPKEAALESVCSLPQCGLRAALLSPETITVPGASVVGCPFFRVCPGCKALVSHTGTGCHNLKCPDCRIWFCFRCMKKGICLENCRIVDNSSSIRDLKL